MAKPPVKRQQLTDLLAQGVREGRPAPGEWMPSERQLVEEHGVGRTTARQALQALAEQGLVEYVRDAGYQVRAQPDSVPPEAPAVPAAELEGIREELRAIHAELRQMNARLASLEERSDYAEED